MNVMSEARRGWSSDIAPLKAKRLTLNNRGKSGRVAPRAKGSLRESSHVPVISLGRGGGNSE